MKRERRFILFDLDGTLVDTSPLHDRAFREALRVHLPARSRSFRYDRVRGLTTRDAFVSVGETDESALTMLVTAKRAAFARLVASDGVQAFPGAIELLAELAMRRIRAFVVTSAARRSARETLRRAGLATHVRGLIAAEDVKHGKPSPEPYLAALREFRLAAVDGLAVEDAVSGIRSANAAGLTTVRVHGRRVAGEHHAWFADLLELRHALFASPLHGARDRGRLAQWRRTSSQ